MEVVTNAVFYLKKGEKVVKVQPGSKVDPKMLGITGDELKSLVESGRLTVYKEPEPEPESEPEPEKGQKKDGK